MKRQIKEKIQLCNLANRISLDRMIHQHCAISEKKTQHQIDDLQ
jgi:hypothetical protein